MTDGTWAPVVERLRSALAHEFEIDGELGHGGMAAVFRARELALNRRVAIKVMAPGLLLGEGMVERFRQEAITVANLQHSNIVAVHGVRAVDDLQLFIMQYVPGRSLDRALREHGPLSVDALRAIMYDVGSALDYAHRRGVIHRDVKPGNILLDTDGDAVVTDFGIAKVAETPGYTRAGMIVGTPTYMSPEQCLGRDVSPASDQYALGVVAYEMLTGRPPFTGDSFALLRAHTDDRAAALRSVRPDVPASVDDAIVRMLAKRPDDRFPDLAAMMEAIGARPHSALDPVRGELRALAGAASSEVRLADLVRASVSPLPGAGPARAATPAGGSRTPPDAASTPAPGVASIEVEVPSEVRAGDRVALTARALDRRGAVLDAGVTWTSRSPSIAAVTSAGVLSARRRGVAVLVAESEGVSRSVSVAVAPPPVSEVMVGDVPPALAVGSTASLRAVVRVARAAGDAGERKIEWRSSDSTIASVSSDGAVTARAPGDVTITALCEGVAGSATLSVVRVSAAAIAIASPPSPVRLGDTVALRATVCDAAGRPIHRPVSWRSTDARVAIVDQQGRVTARAEGWAIVTAAADGVQAHTELLVRQQVVPVSVGGQRESRRLVRRWWLLLVLLASVLVAGWQLLVH